MRILIAACLIVLFTHADAWGASPARDVREGNRLYREEAYDKAVGKYREGLQKDPESAIINFNLGTALYKNGKFRDAIAPLEKSLLTDDDEFRQDAHFNVGNAYVRSGLSQEETNLSGAIESLKRAVSHYDEAVRMDAEDEDARHNDEIAKKELERLKEKQKQQQQQSPNQQQQNQQGQKNRQNQQQQSQQQNQPSQNQSEGNTSQDQSSAPQKPQDGQGKNQEDQNQAPKPAESPKQPSNQKPREQQGQGQGVHGRAESQRQQTAGEQGAMTPQEAQQLLKRYGQTEEPQGLLNLEPRQKHEEPVLKDW